MPHTPAAPPFLSSRARLAAAMGALLVLTACALPGPQGSTAPAAPLSLSDRVLIKSILADDSKTTSEQRFQIRQIRERAAARG